MLYCHGRFIFYLSQFNIVFFLIFVGPLRLARSHVVPFNFSLELKLHCQKWSFINNISSIKCKWTYCYSLIPQAVGCNSPNLDSIHSVIQCVGWFNCICNLSGIIPAQIESILPASHLSHLFPICNPSVAIISRSSVRICTTSYIY